MPAPSFYADTAYDSQQSHQGFQPDYTADEAELPVDDLTWRLSLLTDLLSSRRRHRQI